MWRPHPGQERFLLAKARTKVLACGRRWGKTDACAVQVLESLTDELPRRSLLVAPTKEQATFLFRRLRALVEQLLDRDLWQTKFSFVPRFLESKLNLTCGHHSVSARSAHNGNNLRGDEATDIIVDEAAFVKDHVIQEVLSPMMATTDGALTLISTPNGHNHFYDYFSEGESNPDEFWSLQAPSSDNPMVRQKFLEQQRRLMTPSAFATEYEAQFLQREGYVFDREKVRACVVEPPEEDIPGPTIVSIDWARYQDYSALVVLRGFQGRCSLLEADRQHRAGWAEQIEWVKSFLVRYPNARIVCDTTGVGDGITAWLRNELPAFSVRPCVITAQSKPQLIDGLVKAFESGAIQIPPFDALLKELDNFKAKPTSSGYVKQQAATGNDDLVMALAMAVNDLPYAHRNILRLN